MAQTLPDLRNYQDFVRLLNNAGYEIFLNFIYPPPSFSAIPVITVNHPTSNFEDQAVGLPDMVSLPSEFHKWLNAIRKGLGLHIGFNLKPEQLRFYGFEPGADGLWKKKSAHSTGDILLLDPQGIYGGRLLSAIDENGDELKEDELYGPVNSLESFELILRDRGWLGSSSEPI